MTFWTNELSPSTGNHVDVTSEPALCGLKAKLNLASFNMRLQESLRISLQLEVRLLSPAFCWDSQKCWNTSCSVNQLHCQMLLIVVELLFCSSLGSCLDRIFSLLSSPNESTLQFCCCTHFYYSLYNWNLLLPHIVSWKLVNLGVNLSDL